MASLTGWWRRRSDPARIELYTRSSFYFFALVEVLTLAGPISQAKLPGWIRVGLGCLVLVQAVLCAVLSAAGLDWTMGRRSHPRRLFAAAVGLTAVGALTPSLLGLAGRPVDDGTAALLVVGLIGFGLGALATGVRHPRSMLYGLLGAAVGTGAVVLLLGNPVVSAVGFTIGVLLTGGVTVFANGCSLWLLSVVWELDAARELQAQLAVAEERLRFGRDLHDVMGRNLAVIALKSELAVQLSRRGRPEAVEQMIEVQRIARESQREVRDVVRGYRRADLGVELAGALSVLRAAGIDGRAEGDDGTVLPPEVQAALGWVVREATTNVLRHSEATRCTIRLTGGDAAVLVVDNDGVPDPPAGAVPGSGLAGLRERLATLGGTLDAAAGEGAFRLTASVPLPSPGGPPPAGSGEPAARQRGAAR